MFDDDDDGLPIRKCVCHDRTFEELKATGLPSVEAIRDRFGCTSSCGMCRPYIQLMLMTGDTAFPILAGKRLASNEA